MINWIDVLLLAIIVSYAFTGWQRGFILGVIDLISWAGSIILSFLCFPYVFVAMSKIFPSLGIWLTIVSFLFTFLVIRFLFSFFFSLILGPIPTRIQTSYINKFLGILPGTLNGFITATIVALLLMVLPLSEGLSNQTKKSKVADELTMPAAWLEDKVSPVLDSTIYKTVTALTVEPGSNKTVRLPYTTTHILVRPDLELKMLDLVNEERTKKGLQPLQADTALTALARKHSKDMFAKGYFSHYTGEGEDPFARMQEANIHFLAAGENLALAQTLHTAHNGLMHSPGHRANILNPDFRNVGIGIIDGGIYGLMISQEFKN